MTSSIRQKMKKEYTKDLKTKTFMIIFDVSCLIFQISFYIFSITEKYLKIISKKRTWFWASCCSIYKRKSRLIVILNRMSEFYKQVMKFETLENDICLIVEDFKEKKSISNRKWCSKNWKMIPIKVGVNMGEFEYNVLMCCMDKNGRQVREKWQLQSAEL